MSNRLAKRHLTEALPCVGTTRRNSAGQCTTGHSGSSCSPENNNRIHLWSAEDGIASFCSKYPGNAVPLPGASRNRDVARVVDTATRFQLSALTRLSRRSTSANDSERSGAIRTRVETAREKGRANRGSVHVSERPLLSWKDCVCDRICAAGARNSRCLCHYADARACRCK